jgi:uncharacterized protein
MEQSGERSIAAPRERVWAALNDPEVLKRCIDGCEELTRTGEATLHGVVRLRVGPVSAAFAGDVSLADVDAPTSYALQVSASGGAAGFVRGSAKVRLADEDGGSTRLVYVAEGRVGGKLAQVGQRLIDAAARKTADDFFDRFAAQLVAAETEGEGAAPVRREQRVGGWLMVAAAAALAAGVLAWRLMPR